MTERVYEMLWDCPACGTVGLLGKSQRRCPNCGSPQDADKRYFPKAGEETAVSGHRFEGADWTCGACTTPNGALAKFCQNCGNPQEGNKSVVLQTDKAAAAAQALRAAPPKKPSSKVGLLIAAAVAAVIAIVLVLVLVKKEATVDVVGHQWRRTIDVERYDAVSDSAWCDSLPSGAYSVSRHREERSKKRIADGQDCHDKNVDRGDGTFVVKTECQTKYREEPVYDDKCTFMIDRWHHQRDVVAQGGLAQKPTWPAFSPTGSGRGAEREAKRSERYTLQLRDAKSGTTHECDYPEASWRAVPERSRHTIQVRLVGGAVCDTLK